MAKDPAHANAPDPRIETRAMGLVHVSDAQPGLSRRRRGKGFSYRDADGRQVTDRDELARIRALAIPPAYTRVWICSHPRGHLQATGYDARGRKQYRYHPRWREYRDLGKFDRIMAFGKALPALRRRVRRDLAVDGLPRDKLLALLVRLLDDTLIRIGNDCYTRDNRSYGLTTLRTRHVRAQRGRLRFAFRGKSGQEREVELGDRRLVRIVRRVQQLPGQRLFQYIDDDGQRQPVDSGMVNDYLHAACGNGQEHEFSAKDFRTWGGTVHAARILAGTPLPRKGGEQARRSALAKAVAEVAAILGNTPAVCRGSYIHPRVLEGWLDGSLQRAIPPAVAAHPRQLEQRVLRFLRAG
ncbi:DNA topoisomerase IB [Rhodanobacter sp. FDAARGOS 1247]|uniref:DNA topoisomerase IB n=1 Tax=Rhodanobacter sp. FDAARGOS 1247 TaxID=2778082 RepID=UPI00194DF0B4|nr:DNA topoisomerase IB [Rhodanobacter sp. FDAARGOS 1247]QRP63290.1 DNA topoisomerase IB [Rhodanobacter sp. FDAARGOS 1247]